METKPAAVILNGNENDAEIYLRYQSKLLRLVTSKINQRFQSKLDPDAVVQSVFGSVIRMAAKKPLEFQDDTGLWKWLCTVGLNKTYKKIDELKTTKRDVIREQSGDDVLDVGNLGEPGPDEVVEMSDLLAKIMAPLTEMQRAILSGKLEGHNQEEIAARLGVSSKTVQRQGPAIRDAALKALGADAPAWLLPNDTYEQLWGRTLDEPINDWLPKNLKNSVGSQRRLRELFLEPGTEIAFLTGIKTMAKPKTEKDGKPLPQAVDSLPPILAAAIYMLAIAVAQLRFNQGISKSSQLEKSKRIETILSQPWLDRQSRATLTQYSAFLRSE